MKAGDTLEYISETAAEKLLTFEDCIPLMAETLKALSQKEATQVLRTALPIDTTNILGVMPAVIEAQGLAGCKIITIFPGNFKKGLHSHQGVVVLFETSTGMLKAIVDGTAITAIRTAAVSAVATDTLARSDAQILTLLGSGVQARRHVEAIRLVRDITQVKVWDIDIISAGLFKEDIEREYALPVTICATSSEAVRASDIICTVTAAKEPVCFGTDLSPGVHINAVGACRPNHRELDSKAVAIGRLFGDCIESVLAESGDFLIPLSLEEINHDHLLGELGAVLTGAVSGRTSENDITIFKSLGLAIEDLASADLVYRRYIQSKL